MTFSEAFVKTQMDGNWLAVPVGEAAGKRRMVIRLNETAAMVWDGLAEEKTPEQIAEALTAAYDISPEQAEDDVAELVAHLRQEGILA